MLTLLIFFKQYVIIKLGVSTNLIAMYESGYRMPSLNMLSKISALFNVSIDSLLNDTNSNNNNSINEAMMGISKEQYDALSEDQKKQIRQFIEFIKNYKDK